jgi:hypothetical protein
MSPNPESLSGYSRVSLSFGVVSWVLLRWAMTYEYVVRLGVRARI